MKKAYINASIYKQNNNAILIEDSLIALVGSNAEVLSQTSDQDEIIDLKGMFVLPGFVDSHMHLAELGFYLSCVQLANVHSLEEMKQKMTAQLSHIRQGHWLIARGYNEEKFDDPQKPTRSFLDSISKDIPICATRACGHLMVCNTKALQLADIDEETVCDGGKIDFAEGILEENAINIIHHAWPKSDVQQLEDYILKGIDCCNRYGITTVGSDDFLSLSDDYPLVLDAFEKLSYQDRMHIRVNEQCEFSSPEVFAQFLDEGYTFDVGNDYFRIGPLKLILDGSLGARSAALSDFYHDDPDNKGQLNYSFTDAETYVALANRFNMPTIAHCIGDAAVDLILDVFKEEVYEGNPLHHGLVHCQILRQDQIKEIIEKQYSCYFQSIFIEADADILEERVGKKLAETSYPYKSLYHGTLSSNGSDAPVEMPDALLGIQLACTRSSAHGASINPEQALTIEEAIDSYTIQGAKQLFMDEKIGKIEQGYYADLVVLEEDITKKDIQKVKDTKVMMTIMNGEVVFER